MRKGLLQIIHDIDIVVISHPDPSHLGALPYLVGQLKLQAPIYATAPCHKMGQMFMYDQYLSRQQSSDFSTFTLDDVDAAFRNMRHLKFQQQVKLTGVLPGLAGDLLFLQISELHIAAELQACLGSRGQLSVKSLCLQAQVRQAKSESREILQGKGRV